MRGALCAVSIVLVCAVATPARADDGYDLWMRYHLIANRAVLTAYRSDVAHLVVEGDSPTLAAIRAELSAALTGLLGARVPVEPRVTHDGTVIFGTPSSSPIVARLSLAQDLAALGVDGYLIRHAVVDGRHVIVVAGNRDVAVLYGTFALLRQMQTNGSLATIGVTSVPKVELRMLDHWDNLDGSVERGYAGKSIWEWSKLPADVSPRYRDYARANASIGINGTCITNVNANVKMLTPEYIAKVAAIANVLRPYGIKVFLTAKFSAPLEIGGLNTADPLDAAVRDWWKQKANEIYAAVPDFGGFLIKANSEGQPGPQDYKRSHADGANMFADALAPHGGIVIWRAFVYASEVPTDRIKQAYDEFKPLDGAFKDNVVVQVKNGPLDFQPREPFSPLFGAMPKTPLAVEFQITKEYLGQDTHLVYLGPLFKEVLDADTYANGKGSTVGKVIDGSLQGYKRTVMAGVSNVGSDSNWTGSVFNQANWYAFGRLAWDHDLSAGAIADEWIRMTLSNDPAVVAKVRHMMLISREAVVNYMTPLGLAHIMATGHHYGPGPWVKLGRPDWSPVYYHKADSVGLGFDRTASGSNAVAQYFPPLRDGFASRATVPDSVLLWFHHVRWGEKMKSGRTLWDELAFRYNEGVDSVRAMQKTWATLDRSIDPERFAEVTSFLAIQLREARWWRDAALSYFQTFSKRPIPTQYEQPAHSLAYYQQVRCPANRDKPRCDIVP